MKTKQNNESYELNEPPYQKRYMIIGKENSTFELDAEWVKKQNASPVTLDLIMHLTSELPIGLGSYDAANMDFQTGRKHYTVKQRLRTLFFFCCCFCFLFRSLPANTEENAYNSEYSLNYYTLKFSGRKKQKAKTLIMSKRNIKISMTRTLFLVCLFL